MISPPSFPISTQKYGETQGINDLGRNLGGHFIDITFAEQ